MNKEAAYKEAFFGNLMRGAASAAPSIGQKNLAASVITSGGKRTGVFSDMMSGVANMFKKREAPISYGKQNMYSRMRVMSSPPPADAARIVEKATPLQPAVKPAPIPEQNKVKQLSSPKRTQRPAKKPALEHASSYTIAGAGALAGAGGMALLSAGNKREQNQYGGYQ